MVLYIPGGAGFLPSTVSPKVSYLIFGLPIESKHSCKVEHEFFGGELVRDSTPSGSKSKEGFRMFQAEPHILDVG